jgi:ABC-type uncharacterized transport system involved in gliding motility auxiliary subunit
VEAVPLFSSESDAWLQTGDFAVLPDLLVFFENEKEETRGTKILGAALEGIFSSPFAERGGPSLSPESPAARPSESAVSRIIVVGDTDFASDLMGTAGAGRRNLDFLIKTALWLGRNDALVNLKTRAEGSGRLDRIKDSAKKSGAMNFTLVFNVFVLPAMVILAGIIIIRSFRRGPRR